MLGSGFSGALFLRICREEAGTLQYRATMADKNTLYRQTVPAGLPGPLILCHGKNMRESELEDPTSSKHLGLKAFLKGLVRLDG
jgi:hypothetical protein